MTIGCIIEARMASNRLPGKVMLKVNRKPMIEYLIDRIKRVKKIKKIIIATTKNLSDNILVDCCKKNEINYFRGSENDVLKRVFLAAKKYKLKTVVLITGDCPIVDVGIISHIINTYLKNKTDYASNSHLRTYPDGMDVQVFSFKTLAKANKKAKSRLEREHVTLQIRRNPKLYKTIHITAPNNLYWPELGLTLDEKEDYVLLKKIITYFNYKKKYFFSCKQVIDLLNKKKKWLKINQHIKRKGDN